MINKRIDEPTGTETVGHEWDGIEELDTPMPRWWLWTLYLTIVWGVVYVILYPAWPLVDKATEGVLGWSSRGELADEMSVVDQAWVTVREELSRIPIERLPENSELFAQAVAGGRSAFQVHCSQCHGSGAAGSQTLGYPNLNDDDWIWGGDLKAIEYTLVNGIRSPGVEDTRGSLMPSFADFFERSQLDALVSHVQSLNGEGPSSGMGAQLYERNCSLCHGPVGEGNRELGAPRLNDAIWLYGNSREDIRRQILDPRMGRMPHWSGRLDQVTIKMVSAYVWSLGGGEELIEVAEDPTVEIDEEP
ncbi:cytochrome-c oxidase, cbb3-type subunit III [Erythrobacter arachoides]|uniref:Cbb3-type cytochrome c oxidase subunit n=1 Tax=Aurantiacibacter arachoides TaxID=1850444 RepID=A0A845AA21_9SPHN|nr:cytochrome-c oxidase, cbb3-type subunit III [Aurantiacibacter arachoides]MXO94409.1 cytochrome-c oxidase, cbb3-type subunit III [Aurantiacibacter arachoides]GGD63721.1 Cbb3-type cytochrome c oxidase subunit [Aurantiacibacter arachoides]